MMKTAIAAALGASLLAACTTTPEPSDPLTGTSWRLLEMQSMDDAQGTTRANNPDRYTITFGEDGTAYMKLDCNRGRSSYEAESTGAGQGSLQFGNIASTMAMCPPDSLSEKLGQQLGYVRSYVIRGGRLNMALMADGGILVWEPTEAEGP
ncbi:META domain-containing protein [Erythrobacter sp.]|uniref:META domain-containing protein n=1 Tax=Erythrobacter sp. TaxID=1042 RepID=UPI001425F739|nr:META domain-containing protein [Erythrobacter sp.]QIQ86359.1 MAG: META domain-containing protein [Erythrobacter sp.]